jgi:ribosomal protein L37AE/L43A
MPLIHVPFSRIAPSRISMVWYEGGQGLHQLAYGKTRTHLDTIQFGETIFDSTRRLAVPSDGRRQSRKCSTCKETAIKRTSSTCWRPFTDGKGRSSVAVGSLKRQEKAGDFQHLGIIAI